MNRLGDYLREWAHQLGMLGIIGVGLLFFCLSFYLFTVLPVQRQLAAAPSLSSSPPNRHAMPSPAARGADAVSQLEEFYRFFPPASEIPAVLRHIHNAASKQLLTLDQAAYHPNPEKDGKLIRYEITLPVKGNYPQIREFLRRVLADNPALALETMNVQRQQVGDPTVEAQIGLILYVAGNAR